MYIHIGGECTLSDKYIVGVFDFDGLTRSNEGCTIDFLAQAEREGRLENLPGSLPLSIVLGLDRVYLSPLSTSVLAQRMNQKNSEKNLENEFTSGTTTNINNKIKRNNNGQQR